MPPLLRVSGLKTHFFTFRGTRVVKAVDGVDFVLEEGETMGLVGESGCGKTTTCLSLVRLLPPAGRIVEGSIEFQGDDLVKKSANEMRLNSRQQHRHDPSRPHGFAEPPLQHLHPGWRTGLLPPELARQDTEGACQEPAGVGADSLPGNQDERIPSPDERRHATAHRRRHCPGGGAKADHSRRAHYQLGCHHSGPVPEPAEGHSARD